MRWHHCARSSPSTTGEIYLDGNSLGPVSRRWLRVCVQALDEQWAKGLVRSWGEWMEWPTRLGDRVAHLIGAKPGEVLVADTLTIAFAKLMGAALDQRPDRHVVITDAANFHSDLYIVEAIAASCRSTDHRQGHRSQHAGRAPERRRRARDADPRRLSHRRDARPCRDHRTGT